MEININIEIQRLVQYALKKGMIKQEDAIYSTNMVLDVLGLDSFDEIDVPEEHLESPDAILDNILGWAHQNGVLQHNTPVYRDILDTKLMNCFMPRPSEVIQTFYSLYEHSGQQATQYFYELSKSSNYIRTERVKKNVVWKAATEYGELDITINLSKPEKDPIAIAAARNMKSSNYPKCLLCKQNEGYAGRVDHPARHNHRVIPITLNGEKWFFQYSPYVYYNEHSIVFKNEHEPMKISKQAFDRLLDFVDKFPHYSIGANADLPIVGGSILSHDHFQAGSYEFAMAKAEAESTVKLEKFPHVQVETVKWPMSVLRLKGGDRHQVSQAAEFILEKWQGYSDEQVDVLSHTGDTPHNTVTPIARKRDGSFELDLILRNNRTSEQHPLGIFHPHSEVHHIKKENIGLIEAMGLAVLPARLKDELDKLAHYLVHPQLDIHTEQDLEKHIEWYNYLKNKYGTIQEDNVGDVLRLEVGYKFMTVLEYAGVFKRDGKGHKAFLRFIGSLGAEL